MVRSSSITTATIKRLFACSGNICAFPSCSNKLTEGNTIVGDICHIEGYSPKGPRYNEHSTDADRDAFDNLIVLCKNHHKVIDANEREYTTDKLHEYKKQHEDRYTSEGFTISNELVEKIKEALEISIKDLLTNAYQQRDEKKLSREHQTIVKIIEDLSSWPDSVEELVEKEPDPEKKIMKRFQAYQDKIINEYVKLRPLYEGIMTKIDKEIWLNIKEYQLLVLKLQRDSCLHLEKHNNNPMLALDSMKEEFIQKLEQKWIDYEEGAIQYCLYHRIIKCFIFPNND